MTLSKSIGRPWNSFFYEGFSGESLGLLRLYFGCGLLLFHVSQCFELLTLDPTGVQFYFLEPMWHFALLGMDHHVPILSFVVFAVLMIATLMMALGRYTRTSIAIVILCIFFLKGNRDSFTGDVHHRYLVPMQMLFLLLLSKCGQAHSLDERYRKVKSRIQEWEASWPIKTMQVYCAFFYFWSVIAKIRVAGWAWADGGQIQKELLKRSAMWGVTETGEAVRNQLAFQMAQLPDLLMYLAHLTLAFEAVFLLILFVKPVKWRLIFLLGVTFFHIANFVLLYVGFVFLPVVFLIFFDLVPVHAWLKNKFRRCVLRRPSSPAPA